MITPPLYIGELNDTHLGDLRLAASDLGLVAVEWADSQVHFDAYFQKLKRPIQPDIKKIAPYAKELREYLNGTRTAFTIPIDWSIFRPFQREALQAVYRIPYGETCTYHDIALEIGRPNASRAVGRAYATNRCGLHGGHRHLRPGRVAHPDLRRHLACREVYTWDR